MKGVKSSLKKFASVFSVAFFCLLIFAGCATKEAVKNVSDEDVLRDRATAYWSYRLKGDIDKAYVFEDAYSKKIFSLTKYIQMNSNPSLILKGFEIMDIKVKGEGLAEIKVKTRLMAKVPGAKAFEHDAVQTGEWVKEDGTWYHVIKAQNTFHQ